MADYQPRLRYSVIHGEYLHVPKSYIIRTRGRLHKRYGTARRHARHFVRVLNMKYTLAFVFIERYAMIFCHFPEWLHKHSVRCCFCQLRKWLHARMPGCVYRPVQTLVLIYNSMISTHSFSHDNIKSEH